MAFCAGLRVVAQVAQDFAHVSVVFLFDMGVVIFLVGPAASELNILLIAEGLEMIVDKFRTIVRIDPQQFERQSLFNVLHGAQHPDLALAHHRTAFHPGGMDVGDVERVQKLP